MLVVKVKQVKSFKIKKNLHQYFFKITFIFILVFEIIMQFRFYLCTPKKEKPLGFVF